MHFLRGPAAHKHASATQTHSGQPGVKLEVCHTVLTVFINAFATFVRYSRTVIRDPKAHENRRKTKRDRCAALMGVRIKYIYFAHTHTHAHNVHNLFVGVLFLRELGCSRALGSSFRCWCSGAVFFLCMLANIARRGAPANSTDICCNAKCDLTDAAGEESERARGWRLCGLAGERL